jgi:hypothetical protein
MGAYLECYVESQVQRKFTLVEHRPGCGAFIIFTFYTPSRIRLYTFIIFCMATFFAFIVGILPLNISKITITVIIGRKCIMKFIEFTPLN